MNYKKRKMGHNIYKLLAIYYLKSYYRLPLTPLVMPLMNDKEKPNRFRSMPYTTFVGVPSPRNPFIKSLEI